MSEINFFFEDIKETAYHPKTLKRHVISLILNELMEVGDISIIFCSDVFLLEMNKEYLNHNYFTDIITFDYVEGSIISGDLFISLDRINDNAKSFETERIKELYRVVFHGVLHLIGYNDKTGEEQKIMQGKENYYLSEVDFGENEL
ncbi:MAG: rRNA maturation RNase YbeY [Bacteroidota bacterium]